MEEDEENDNDLRPINLDEVDDQQDLDPKNVMTKTAKISSQYTMVGDDFVSKRRI